jgi:similar to stage IV sporulation protein
MKEYMSKRLSGIVHIKIIGFHTELFLNRCIAERIPIWNIRRISKECLTAYLFVDDVLYIRPLLRESDCKIRFIEKKGLPFLLKKIWSRSGLVIGIFFFLSVLFFLSNIIWNIEIEGAKPETEYKIEKALKDMGLKKGEFIFLLPTNQEIQQALSEQIKEITWVGVQLKGTTYEFDVVEKELAKEKESLNPRNLVAKKTAVITNMVVEQGQQIAKENDFVEEGELLISGIIGNEKNPQFVPAKGKVLGKVWYGSEVKVPLNSTFYSYTGESKEKHYITLFGLKIPIWGFSKISYKEVDVKEQVKSLNFLRWKIPIAYSREINYEADKHERTYTKEEAVDVGIKMAEDELAGKLSDEAKIIDMKIRHQSFVNGTVNLKIYFGVIENIVKESPIVKVKEIE